MTPRRVGKLPKGWKRLRESVSVPGELGAAAWVFVSSRRGPGLGRTERRMLKVMRELRAHGASVTFIGVPHNPVTEQARLLGVTCVEYKLNRFNVLRTTSRLRKYLTRLQPPVVHSIGQAADTLCRLAARPLATKVVNSIECEDWPERGEMLTQRMRHRVNLRTVRLADVLVVDCGELADALRAEGVQTQVVVDPASIDLSRVYRQAEAPFTPPCANGLPLVGYAGALDEARGALLLPGLAHRLAGEALVAVAGSGPVGEALGRLAPSSGLRYLGRLDSAAALLLALDVAVFPSVGRGTPMSMLEAAALGRPVVASDVAGVSGLFTDEEVALVPPGDMDALVEAVRALLADPERALRMGEAARLRTIDEYSSVASVRRYLELYRRLMLE